MTSPDQSPTTAHDPTAKPLLEELPDALAEIERMLAPLHPADHSIDEKSPIARARAELNRIVMQIRQSAPAELEPMWLRVPTADAKTILYTVDRALAGDPTGGVLLRWPAYDALRHLLWRSDKLFAAVIGLLQDRGRADVALRLRNGSPDTTALQGLSSAADKEFIATARVRMAAARVAEVGEVEKIGSIRPGAAGDDVVATPGSTTQGNGGQICFNPSTDTGALADAAWRAEGEEIRDRASAQGPGGPWSNITPYLVAQELRRVPDGGTLLGEPWISAIAYHHEHNRRRWLEIRNVLRQYNLVASVTDAIRDRCAALRAQSTVPPTRTAWAWGAKLNSSEWWLVEMRNGEPHRAYHPEHGEIQAYRDSFGRWSHNAMPIPETEGGLDSKRTLAMSCPLCDPEGKSRTLTVRAESWMCFRCQRRGRTPDTIVRGEQQRQEDDERMAEAIRNNNQIERERWQAEADAKLAEEWRDLGFAKALPFGEFSLIVRPARPRTEDVAGTWHVKLIAGFSAISLTETDLDAADEADAHRKAIAWILPTFERATSALRGVAASLVITEGPMQVGTMEGPTVIQKIVAVGRLAEIGVDVVYKDGVMTLACGDRLDRQRTPQPSDQSPPIASERIATVLRVITERLSAFAPHELKAEIETLGKLERDIVQLGGASGQRTVAGTGGDAQMPGGTRRPEDYFGGKVTIVAGTRGEPTPVATGGTFRLQHEPLVSPSEGLRRAMTEIDRGLEGYKLAPELELARIQVDVLLLLVETLRGDFESRLGSAVVGALEHVSEQREREHNDRWKGVDETRRASKPDTIADLRAVASTIRDRLGIRG